MKEQEEVKAIDQPTLSVNDLLNAVKVMAQEMKKPSEEEQAKKDLEKARMLQNQQNSIAEAKSHAAQKHAHEEACSHMKAHPYQSKINIVAQMHSDGLYHPLCLTCQKEFKPFPAGNDTVPNGVSFKDYANITPRHIEGWGERHEQRMKKLELVGA